MFGEESDLDRVEINKRQKRINSKFNLKTDSTKTSKGTVKNNRNASKNMKKKPIKIGTAAVCPNLTVYNLKKKALLSWKYTASVTLKEVKALLSHRPLTHIRYMKLKTRYNTYSFFKSRLMPLHLRRSIILENGLWEY